MDYVWQRRNEYELLEVGQEATDKVIRRAFKIQSKAWHPDGFGGFDSDAQVEATLRTEAILAARDVLLNPDTRADLDVDVNIEEPDSEWFTNPLQGDWELWKAMARWMKQEDEGTPFDRKMAFTAGDLIERRRRPSDKQIQHMLRVWDESFGHGFSRAVAEGLE